MQFSIPQKNAENLQNKIVTAKIIGELYQRVSYPDVLEREKIEESEQYANNYRFIALFDMIGYGATGLYPNLSAHWEELQQDINNYVSILSKEK